MLHSSRRHDFHECVIILINVLSQNDTPFVTLLLSSAAKTAFEVDSSTELAPIHSIVKKGDPRFLREVVKAIEGAPDSKVKAETLWNPRCFTQLTPKCFSGSRCQYSRRRGSDATSPCRRGDQGLKFCSCYPQAGLRNFDVCPQVRA